MNKNFVSLCAFLFFVLHINLHSQWENISNQIPGDSTNNLSDVVVPNRWAGFISSGSNPEMYRSEFSTGMWEVLQTPSPVAAFFIVYYDLGFMCGTDSSVYQTTDAGESWSYIGSPGEKINDIDVGYDIYNLSRYICGNNGIIGSIEDTGLVIIYSGIATNFSSISAPSKDNVWIIGDSSIYFYDGNTFTKQLTSTTILNSIYFMNKFYGWVVGNSGYIAKTTNGGNTWVQKQNPDPLSRNLNDVFLVSYFGFAVGDNGLILETTNAGESWTMNSAQLTTNDLLGVHISGGGVEWGPGLTVGENNTALLYPVVVFVDEEPYVIDEFYLYQNYPNPFNPSTKIRFTIPSVSLRQAQGNILVSLKVYDVLGHEIATLVSEEKDPGTYKVEFDGTDLPSGIYFYQLKTKRYIQTRKMVLLK